MFRKKYEDEEGGVSVYQNPESEGHFMVEASQDSELGWLAFDSFLERGIVGPQYDISEFPVNFYYSKKFDSSINVSLYDMDITIGEDDKNYKNYKKIKDYLENLVK